ncbi:MAG: SDR family oxidoreductase [Acidimicrobiales bacterium]|nr:SDR family oxidoreductase [Acidimicrobiales bacterium]
MRIVVIGGSSGLGRCIGIGLSQRGHDIALLARRKDRLDAAVEEAGGNAHAIACDVTDEAGCRAAIEEAAQTLGGIDGLVYTTGVGTLGMLTDLDAETWQHAFATNVIGASIATSAALPHLRESSGTAIYLSSISASMTPPWPGLGAYITSKAALDKLVDAWRAEHPDVGFTRFVVGDCGGGEGDGATGFTSDWDMELATELGRGWYEKGYIAGALIDVEELVGTTDAILARGNTAVIPSVTIVPRVPQG